MNESSIPHYAYARSVGVSGCPAGDRKPSGASRLRRAIGLGLRPGERRLLAGGPLAFGEHGAGLFAGGGVDQVVAEEDLRGCCAGDFHKVAIVLAM